MEDDLLKKYRDRLRIILILYVFSEPVENDTLASVFRTEMRIQALDFLLRYPDFLSMELLKTIADNPQNSDTVRTIVRNIFNHQEPELRVDEMQKFFHGAYESIDDVIAFLCSTGFIKYESKRRTDGKEFEKLYHLTHTGKTKIESSLLNVPSVKWYLDRCQLIQTFFGSLNGSELKRRQYLYVKEYANIPYTHKIKQIQSKVKESYYSIFNEALQ